ncbi:MAG: hypothetical protein K940chlam5_01008 [Candidatus Anoxychlamydiales bacterium]|uniref:DUF4062 domain-containing protein n=1 Tax=marine sediment metagenome TaxID=412755 RepID=A0A0F9IX00_9ZZZZ|nr:hypothetical protein [Candidatus Anoxychlamydiales bacterium]
MYVAEKAIREDNHKLRIFSLMPFKDKLTQIYEKYIKAPLESEGYSIKRADDIFTPTPILDDILMCIEEANIIIAELTGKNPNVFYELGRAHEKENTYVIQICQDKKDIPFDLQHIRTIIYNDSPKGCEKLKKDLLKYVENYLVEYKKRDRKEEFNGKKKREEIVSYDRLREYIESIKKYGKRKISDLVVTLSFIDLKNITKLIYGELILIEDWEEVEKNAILFDFLHFSIILREDKDETIALLELLIKNINAKKIKGYVKLYERFIIYLDIDYLKDLIIKNNHLKVLLNLFINSYNWRDAEITSGILLHFKDTFSQDQVIKIINASLENDQIYGSGGGRRNVIKIIKTKSELIRPNLVKKLKEKGLWFE